MQDKDEEIYTLYLELDEQEKVILKKDNTILKMGIIIAALGLIIIASVVIAIFKIYGKFAFPWSR